VSGLLRLALQLRFAAPLGFKDGYAVLHLGFAAAHMSQKHSTAHLPTRRDLYGVVRGRCLKVRGVKERRALRWGLCAVEAALDVT